MIAFLSRMLIFDLPVMAQIASMTVAASQKPMASPCIKTCALDPGSGLCVGCGRSLAEISGWIGYSDRQRASIMAELPQRLASLARSVSPKRT